MTDPQPGAPARPPAVAPGNVAVITGGAGGIGLAVADAWNGTSELCRRVVAGIDPVLNPGS